MAEVLALSFAVGMVRSYLENKPEKFKGAEKELLEIYHLIQSHLKIGVPNEWKYGICPSCGSSNSKTIGFGLGERVYRLKCRDCGNRWDEKR